MDLSFIWNEFLVRPLFNTLIWMYNEMAGQNLGTAIILFTVALRFVLLPLSILSIFGHARSRILQKKLHELNRDFKGDRVAVKQEMRRALKKYKLRPWARVLNLAIQGLVLLVLYQVFITGLRGEAVVHLLYPWVDFPGIINTMFFGFDIGEKNLWWAIAVGAVLFLEVYAEARKRGTSSRQELWFALIFPLFSVFILSYLPMVKSLFILTSIAFSAILMVIEHACFSADEE